jgi:hypothetical protein
MKYFQLFGILKPLSETITSVAEMLKLEMNRFTADKISNIEHNLNVSLCSGAKEESYTHNKRLFVIWVVDICKFIQI